MYTCLRTVDPYLEYYVADWEAAASMAVRIWLARFPPPVASKASVADVAATASLRSRLNDDALESRHGRRRWIAGVPLARACARC